MKRSFQLLLILNFLVLGPVSAPLNKRSSHEEAVITSEIDACPDLTVYNESGEKVQKLRFIDDDNGNERLCCACGRGERLVDLCLEGAYNTTVCEPCAGNTYMEEDVHTNKQCVADDLKCSPEDELYIPSTLISKPECHCRPDRNLFRDGDGKCKSHSKCEPGKGVKYLGTQFSDTVCVECDDQYESPSNSATERCKPKTSVNDHPRNQIYATTPLIEETIGTHGFSTSAILILKTLRPERSKTNFVWIGLVVAFLCVSIILVAYIHWKKLSSHELVIKLLHVDFSSNSNKYSEEEQVCLTNGENNRHQSDNDQSSRDNRQDANLDRQNSSDQINTTIFSEKERKVLEYFTHTSTSTAYCFAIEDGSMLVSKYQISGSEMNQSEPGVYFLEAVRNGFLQKKLSVEDLIQYLKSKGLITLVQELEEKFQNEVATLFGN